MAISLIPQPTYRVVEFTSSGNWICPANVRAARFLVVGAGGGGGGVTLTNAAHVGVGGGGGGGEVAEGFSAVTPGSTYTITIGSGGLGGTATFGATGGNSSVALGATTIIIGRGGGGGGGYTSNKSSSTVDSWNAGGDAEGRTSANLTLGGGGGGSADIYTDTLGGGVLRANPGRPAGFSVLASTLGRAGKNNFGGGGGGGYVHTSAPTVSYVGLGTDGGGNGAIRSTTGITNGGNATANTGSGGGGASAHTNTGAAIGGNGGSGLVRIEYFG